MALIQIGCPLALQPPWQVRSVDALLPYSGMQETVGGSRTGSWKSERAGKKKGETTVILQTPTGTKTWHKKGRSDFGTFLFQIFVYFFAFFPL